jgi:hypothetical protein
MIQERSVKDSGHYDDIDSFGDAANDAWKPQRCEQKNQNFNVVI